MTKLTNIASYVRSNVSKNIWVSTIIEGLHLSYYDVEKILMNIPLQIGDYDQGFVQNMNKAWRMILSSLGYQNGLPIIKQINKSCCFGLSYDCGELRQHDAVIRSSYHPGIPNERTVLEHIRSIDAIDDPIERAFWYFCYIVREQLFIDGNCRTAMLIANKILIESGIGYIYMNPQDVQTFLDCMTKYYESGKPENMFDLLKSYIKYV